MMFELRYFELGDRLHYRHRMAINDRTLHMNLFEFYLLKHKVQAWADENDIQVDIGLGCFDFDSRADAARFKLEIDTTFNPN